MKIGFIGLGVMGRPMAVNLLKAGYELMVYDIVSENVQALAAQGAEAAVSVRDLASASEVVITMLPDSPHVQQVISGIDGVLAGATPGTIIIDMSSIEPTVSQELCRICEERGVSMLDAPVSGGEPKAIDGTLAVMVGGDKAVYEQVYPIMEAMASSIVYCGGIGAGNITKLANQIIVALNIAAVSEALMLSTKAGVNPEMVFAAIKGGLAGSTVMNAKVPMILERNFTPGFRIDLHIKDINNALQTGHKCGCMLPLTAQIMEMLQLLHAEGEGMSDHSAIVKYYEQLMGMRVSACDQN